jgi:hypothetical protein
MSIATQLLDVGYKPTKKYKTSREELARNDHNLALIQMSERQERLDGWVPKPRVIRVVYQGGWYRAFYEGTAQSTLGASPSEARSRLKYFSENSSSHKQMMKGKFEGANNE